MHMSDLSVVAASEIIGELESLRLNQARIDTLVEQLYDINKRLIGYEGRQMRLAESHGVVREDFLKNYLGSELDPLWLNRVSKLLEKGWKSLVVKDKDKIKLHRQDIHTLAVVTGLDIGEFRKIVHVVQKGKWERAKPRRKWWRRTRASSSRSLRNPPTVVYSSWTSSKKAISA
jgi:RNA polymerase primary sigma factor